MGPSLAPGPSGQERLDRPAAGAGVVSPGGLSGGELVAGILAQTATPHGGEGGRPGALTRVVASPRAGPFLPWVTSDAAGNGRARHP